MPAPSIEYLLICRGSCGRNLARWVYWASREVIRGVSSHTFSIFDFLFPPVPTKNMAVCDRLQWNRMHALKLYDRLSQRLSRSHFSHGGGEFHT